MSNAGASGGIGFFGILQIIFIVLKLCNLIHWSWIWVLSPIWISLAMSIILIIVVLFSVRRSNHEKKKKTIDDTKQD